MEKLCLKPKEAAELLSISPRTLWQWTHDGKIPHVCMGDGQRKCYLYPVEGLRAWLAAASTKEG